MIPHKFCIELEEVSPTITLLKLYRSELQQRSVTLQRCEHASALRVYRRHNVNCVAKLEWSANFYLIAGAPQHDWPSVNVCTEFEFIKFHRVRHTYIHNCYVVVCLNY
jgi:hypothetical protein